MNTVNVHLIFGKPYKVTKNIIFICQTKYLTEMTGTLINQ